MLVVMIMVAIAAVSCTKQQMVRNYGGTETVKLPPNQRLLNATWKGDQLWYIVEPMPEGYIPTTKTFKEKSAFGVVEGSVIFIESK